MAAKDIEAGRAHVLIAIRDRLSQGLKTAEAKLRAFGSSVALSAGVLTGGIGAAIAWPIKLAANMEQTKTAFAVFLGSADLADKKLKEIEAMGAATPFTFDDLKDSAQMLLQFGVSADALMPTLKNIGDVSAGNADKFQRLSLAFGQTMAAGRLMGGEVKQMREAGFNPLQEMARTTGKSMAKLSEEMEAGNISSRQLAMSFATASASGGQFDNMMDKQSGTLVGLFSTLQDNAAIAARALGDAMMPALKSLAQVGISVTKWITDFIKNNQALVAIAGKVALVILAVSGAVAGIGAVILGASFVVGLMASAFATLATLVSGAFGMLAVIPAVLTAIGTAVVGAFSFLIGLPALIVGIPALLASLFASLFSPLGIGIAVLVGLVAAVIYFRKEIMSALSGVVAYFQPLITSVMQLYGIFMQTFGGIVAALQSGSLETAATIAWAGFSALAWTAIADMTGAFDSLLGFLESYLPGISEMFNTMFAGIGTAILAGRWDLAGQLAMAKLYLVMTQGMNAIAFAWDMLVTGFQTVFDSIFTGVKSAFWATIYGFANGIAWLSAQISSLLGLEDPLQGAAEGLKQMEQEQKTADEKAAFMRDQGRMKRNEENAANRGKAESEGAAKIARIEVEIAAASAEVGSPTVNTVAEGARKALDDATAKAKAEADAKKQLGTKAAEGPQALAGAANTSKAGGKGGSASSGTFSAIASALGNRTGANAAESTAKNTAQLVKIARKQLEKPEPGLAP